MLRAELSLQLTADAVQSVSDITVKIRQGEEDLNVVRYKSPVSVAQVQQALLAEDTRLIGFLQEEDSSIRVVGDQQLEPGSSNIFTLQPQAGECYLLLLLV